MKLAGTLNNEQESLMASTQKNGFAKSQQNFGIKIEDNNSLNKNIFNGNKNRDGSTSSKSSSKSSNSGRFKMQVEFHKDIAN